MFTPTSLPVGQTFKHHGAVYTVEAINLAADRCDLSATFNRRPLTTWRGTGQAATFRWSVTYVLHLLNTGKVQPNPLDRCDHCGEPFREGARFGDGDQQAEVVDRGRHLLVHVECGIALAASRGKSIDEILA